MEREASLLNSTGIILAWSIVSSHLSIVNPEWSKAESGEGETPVYSSIVWAHEFSHFLNLPLDFSIT